MRGVTPDAPYRLTPDFLDAPTPTPILASGQGVGTTLLSQQARRRVLMRWPVSRPTRGRQTSLLGLGTYSFGLQ